MWLENIYVLPSSKWLHAAESWRCMSVSCSSWSMVVCSSPSGTLTTSAITKRFFIHRKRKEKVIIPIRLFFVKVEQRQLCQFHDLLWRIMTEMSIYRKVAWNYYASEFLFVYNLSTSRDWSEYQNCITRNVKWQSFWVSVCQLIKR